MRPIWDMNRYLHERVQHRLVDDLAPEGVLHPWELLCGDDLDVEVVFRALGEEVFVGAAQREGFEDVACSAVSLEHGVVDHVTQIYIQQMTSKPHTHRNT